MSYAGQPCGVSGMSFDKLIEAQSLADASALEKFQHQFYVAKEVVTRKLNKTKSDKDVTASDTELDTKLELFRSIQTSSSDLHKTVMIYQHSVCRVAQSLNSLGRFLKDTGKTEKAFAGKVMFSVGKVMSFSAIHALAVKEPIDRLQQEVETFRLRAIQDCLRTVKKTEKNRQQYRGMLIWMKEISEELNPDAYKQLEKFRKVQHQVRASKQNFDKDKLDCMQKIDLLAASRCNMFSHALQLYQEKMTQFWKKSDQAAETALQAIEQRNFKKKKSETGGTDSSISLDLEKSVSETDMAKEEEGNLVDVEIGEMPEAPAIPDDLLGALAEAKEANEEMDELFRKFSKTRLKTDQKKASLDTQFDAIFGLNEPVSGAEKDEKQDLQSVFQGDGDLLTSGEDLKGSSSMGFLPSHLLDSGSGGDDWLTGGASGISVNPVTPSGDTKADQQADEKKAKTLSWFNSLAELDPLSDEAKMFGGEQA